MKRVRMSLGERSYDIRIGSGAIGRMPGWLKPRGTRRAFVIADQRLREARASLTSSLAKAGWEVKEIAVPAGEPLKDIRAVYPLYGRLLEARANRDSVLFALGGGSIGDAAGFVASTYLRGISWVGVPTTLLAQVDSSMGGKTGINHEAGKNLIGTFHQPELVVCDTDFLGTLKRREIVSGLGETVKYAITFDPAFFAYLEKRSDGFLGLDPKVLATSIEKSARWKCEAVSKDEFDRRGVREVLNFGHTFGHAIEAIGKYRAFQHGEAVIWGMRFALALSVVRKRLAPAVRERIDAFLAGLDVPALPRGFGPREMLSHMMSDKKVRDGKIHFVLLRDLGQAMSDNGVRPEDLVAAYAMIGAGKRKKR